MHLTKVRKLIFSLGPILIFLRTLVRFPSVMAWCRFILGYMAKSVCSCFLWPLSGMHKAYKKYSHLILYRIFCKNSVCLLWQFRQICVFLSKLLSPSITFWANVICSLWRNITYWSLPILNIHNTIHLRRKIQGKTLEYGIYQLNLQLHTHPASHKNSALWVSLLFVIQKRYKRMTSPK